MVVIETDSRIGLGSKVVILLEGVDEYIDKRVDQEETQEEEGGQQP